MQIRKQLPAQNGGPIQNNQTAIANPAGFTILKGYFMGIVLVMGAQESSKDAIIEVLQEDRSIPKFEYMSLHEDGLDRNNIKKSLKDFNNDIERFVTENLKSQRRNIIINIPITIETNQGYVPVLSGGFFDVIDPDLIIIIEEMPNIRLRSAERKRIREQQEVNREHAVRYSSGSNSPLKIIKVKPGDVKSAIREAKGVIKPLMS